MFRLALTQVTIPTCQVGFNTFICGQYILCAHVIAHAIV